MTSQAERVIKQFPEVATVVSRIGRPEIATDPMGPNMGDTYVFLKPRDQWPKEYSREELVEQMEDKLKALPTQAYSFSQPIEFRMQELIEGTGARSDVVIKIFGDDLDTLREQAEQVARIIRPAPGATDVKVEQVTGLPVLQITIDRDANRPLWHQCFRCRAAHQNCRGRNGDNQRTRGLPALRSGRPLAPCHSQEWG
jgi:cobalt-zinc-cadmium resistance protein CzcA